LEVKDEWIVGDSTSSGRSYVVHAIWPRFIIEIIEVDNDEWKVGTLDWIDDPSPNAAASWTKKAADVFFDWIQVAVE